MIIPCTSNIHAQPHAAQLYFGDFFGQFCFNLNM
jgi:hypothetical protein